MIIASLITGSTCCFQTKKLVSDSFSDMTYEKMIGVGDEDAIGERGVVSSGPVPIN